MGGAGKNGIGLWRGSTALGCLLLAGCGGGGGVNSTPTPPTGTVPPPTPTPVPTPTPAPTPTPPPTPATNYDTAEYRATVGAVSMDALAAYQRGATGAGITVGVIDSGIDVDSPEFAGRIAAQSANVAGGTTVDDENGHGTAVAFTLAGRRNDAGTHGVAFDSTLVVARSDTPGSCATPATGGESACSFNDDNIARGVDLARTAGARVINISLGGEDAAPSTLLAAISRATAAGVVVVISAGNEGTANPSASAAFANNDAVSRGLVVIAGSVGAGDTISSFSNRAGDSAAHYLTAVGERVRAPDASSTAYLWSGTSFSAPQIAGAAALLAQAFPNLSGAQIVDILFRSARDAGASGVDATYGRGVLDLTRAFQPIGTTTVAGSGAGASLTGNGVLSSAMGDARMGTLGAVILDGYDRAFAINLASTIARYRPTLTLAPALEVGGRAVSLAAGGMSAAMTLAPTARGGMSLGSAQLSPADARSARVLAASVTQALGSRARFGFAVRSGADGLAVQMTGQHRPAFLVARDDGLGFDAIPRTATAMRAEVGRVGITTSVENGDALARRDPLIAGLNGWNRAGYTRAGVALDGQAGALGWSLGTTRLSERATVLGAQFDPSLGGLSATSWFADARARLNLPAGWSLGGSLRGGWTQIAGSLSAAGRLRTAAFAADIGKDGVLGGDSIGLRIAQPMRVAAGGADLTLPTGWDYRTRQVTGWTTQRIDLSPTGREFDAEMRYGRPFIGGWMEGNLYWRLNPGNIAAIPDDQGMALRYSRPF